MVADEDIELASPAGLDNAGSWSQFFTNRGSVTRHPREIRFSHRAVNDFNRHGYLTCVKKKRMTHSVCNVDSLENDDVIDCRFR